MYLIIIIIICSCCVIASISHYALYEWHIPNYLLLSFHRSPQQLFLLLVHCFIGSIVLFLIFDHKINWMLNDNNNEYFFLFLIDCCYTHSLPIGRPWLIIAHIIMGNGIYSRFILLTIENENQQTMIIITIVAFYQGKKWFVLTANCSHPTAVKLALVIDFKCTIVLFLLLWVIGF